MKKQNEFKVGAIINRPQKSNNGITLIALVLTLVVHYVKDKKCSKNNSFLFMNN